ncbi:hypothetical protein F5B22DRAFT_616515 [Xylaria bambusicola]|uniref:uncharacterized protein n=1 Tax=Xylaria bambusicola TaxID=326684 RepID=UPI002008A7CA|nr:uncharacterized protein F5B22DRAFT_616515 [Xylaria bambusicola]KAI0509492.1 hypothetical protein F5B22DRAFT_616515 [Xylaria bambusicola]
MRAALSLASLALVCAVQGRAFNPRTVPADRWNQGTVAPIDDDKFCSPSSGFKKADKSKLAALEDCQKIYDYYNYKPDRDTGYMFLGHNPAILSKNPYNEIYTKGSCQFALRPLDVADGVGMITWGDVADTIAEAIAHLTVDGKVGGYGVMDCHVPKTDHYKIIDPDVKAFAKRKWGWGIWLRGSEKDCLSYDTDGCGHPDY